MKKILTLAVSLCFLQYSIAQNPNANANVQWRINGNSASTTDFIGTTNNQSLILKTNNVQRVLFDTQGKTIFDGGSEVIIHPGGLNRPILSNPIAQYMLKVGGSGHFEGEVNTRQLFVQEYITYLKSLKGPRIDVDTIRMDSTRGIFGHTKIFGDVQIKQNLIVDGDINTTSLSFGSVLDRISVTTTVAPDGARIIGFGTRPPISLPPSTCMSPFITGDLQQTHRFTITNSSNSFTSNMLDFKNDGQNGFIDYGYDISLHPVIDLSGGSLPATPIPALKLNSACWGDVEIAKGGGFASMGKYFEVGSPVRNGNIASNIFANNRIGQRITVNSPFPSNYTNPPVLFNSQFFVNRNFIHAISVFNTDLNSNGDETFTVFGDGRTVIGAFRPAVGYMLSVSGKIMAEEVVVQLKSSWPDYVFHKDYKLKPLSEVEQYILKNKHLQNIPSAKEIEANGVTLGNVVSKQMEKIEELTLYLIEQQKQIEELKKQVESLKK